MFDSIAAAVAFEVFRALDCFNDWIYYGYGIKKKRQVISIDLKRQIIAEKDKGQNSTELGKKFKLQPSTVRSILGDRAAILRAIDRSGEAKRTRLYPVKHDDLEEAILRWFKAARSENVEMSGPLLQEKARKLAKELANQLRKGLGPRPLNKEQAKLDLEACELEAFQPSDGWLGKFKNRHSIVFKGNQGEAADIDLAALGNWQQEVLRESISHFSADDVFNADETGLFWQLLPNKTLAFKGERCSSGKKSKERITVLVRANMSGTEKLPVLVIGKSAKPRCFKNAEPPVAYKANRKAWMTADLFESWLKEWERKLKREGRNVLLFLDNFSGHANIKLEQITLKFLPPNTTAASQPCDQGNIQNLKVHYRRLLLRERIASIENKTGYKVDLLMALQFLRRSWSNVKQETLASCFRKAGFVKTVEPAEPKLEEQLGEEMQPVEGDSNEELDTLWMELQALDLVEGNLDDYLAVDDQLATGGTLTLTQIAENVSTAEVVAEVESDTDVMEVDEEPELPLVTAREANKALRVLQRRYSSNPAMLELCDKMDDLMAKERMKNLKQNNITDYFVVNP